MRALGLATPCPLEAPSHLSVTCDSGRLGHVPEVPCGEDIQINLPLPGSGSLTRPPSFRGGHYSCRRISCCKKSPGSRLVSSLKALNRVHLLPPPPALLLLHF